MSFGQGAMKNCKMDIEFFLTNKIILSNAGKFSYANKKYIIYPQTNLKGFFTFCILYCIDLQRAALSAMQEKCRKGKKKSWWNECS